MLLGARQFFASKPASGPELLDFVRTNATQYSSNWNASYSYTGAYIDTGYKVTPQTTLEVECGWDEYQSNSWDAPVGSGASGVWNNSLVAVAFPKWDAKVYHSDRKAFKLEATHFLKMEREIEKLYGGKDNG
jgi:hypothetical protein